MVIFKWVFGKTQTTSIHFTGIMMGAFSWIAFVNINYFRLNQRICKHISENIPKCVPRSGRKNGVSRALIWRSKKRQKKKQKVIFEEKSKSTFVFLPPSLLPWQKSSDADSDLTCNHPNSERTQLMQDYPPENEKRVPRWSSLISSSSPVSSLISHTLRFTSTCISELSTEAIK